MSYVLEQGIGEALAHASIAVALYGLLLAAVALLMYASLGTRAAAAFLAASLAVIWAFAAAIVFAEFAALYFRHVPHGSGANRQGEDYERFVALAQAAIVGLYVLWAAIALALGSQLRRRFDGRQRIAATATVVAVLGFLIVSVPPVEFMNSCYIGRPIALQPSC